MEHSVQGGTQLFLRYALCSMLYALCPMPLSDQGEAQPWDISDDREGKEKDGDEWERGHDDREHRLLKTEAGDEKVHSDRRGGGSNLKIGEKDDAEGNRVEPLGIGHRRDGRN